MASLEHLSCSNFVKSVHQKLRKNAKLMGVEEAWRQHCEDQINLQKYASCMQSLAIEHWGTKDEEISVLSSRIQWSYQTIKDYYFGGEKLKHTQKETEIADKIGLTLIPSELEYETKIVINVLDVGSCYNPFKCYPCLNVIPIDIAPATADVHKCDFLSVKTVPTFIDFPNCSELKELPQYYFDVVLFCLMLEYLPSPEQRESCCEKAYDVLKTGGILIIITPDSNHVGANAKIMKSWRFLLAKLGFARIKYDKLKHLHCMAFRKSLKQEIAARWASLQDETQFYRHMVIPQDFHKVTTPEETSNGNSVWDTTLFNELPFVS